MPSQFGQNEVVQGGCLACGQSPPDPPGHWVEITLVYEETGEPVEGELEAADEPTLVSQLQAQGLLPVETRSAGGLSASASCTSWSLAPMPASSRFREMLRLSSASCEERRRNGSTLLFHAGHIHCASQQEPGPGAHFAAQRSEAHREPSSQ